MLLICSAFFPITISAQSIPAPPEKDRDEISIEQDDGELIIVDEDEGDELIIIDEDEGDELIIIEDGDDDGLIIIDDDSDGETEGLIIIDGDEDSITAGKRPPPLPLRADFLSVSGRVLTRGAVSYGLSRLADPWRGLAEGVFGVDIRPQNPWRAHIDAFVRGQGRAALPALDYRTEEDLQLQDEAFGSSARAELGEAYLRLRVPKGSLTLGRQVFSWSRTEIARLGDLVNPVDHRSGVHFPLAQEGRLPVLSLSGRVLLGQIAIQAAWVPIFEPPRVQFFASDSRALNITNPPVALAPSPSLLGLSTMSRVYRDTREAITEPRTNAATSEVALRATGTAAGIDLGAQIFAGYDRTPALSLPPGMALMLGLANDGIATKGANAELARLCPSPTKPGGCSPMRDLVQLDYQRTLVGQIDGAAIVGPAVLKAELQASPDTAPLPGSVVHLISSDSNRLYSSRLPKLSAALSLATGYGEWVQGALEVIDIAYLNVPAGNRVARVEPVDTPVGLERTAHRLAIAIDLHGALLDNEISWRCAALASPIQLDYAIAPKLTYHAALGQEMAMGAEIMGGPEGTVGGFFERSSRLYLEWRLRF